MNSSAQATTLPKTTNQAISASNKGRWTGRILSTLAVLFMLFDSVSHLIMPKPVADAFVRVGYSPSLGVYIGIVGLICVALYAIPRSSILGAILLTGFLGGATAANLRVADPLFEILFPVLFGALVWAGVTLRNDLPSRLFLFHGDADRAFPGK